MQRRPGDFSGSTTGRRRLIHPGWRRFSLKDSRIVTETPGTVPEDPNDHVTSFSETAGTSVVHGYSTVTLTNGCGAGAPGNVGVWPMPLTNRWGEAVNFADGFCLMTMLEFVSISGDYGGGSEHEPLFGLGICSNATNIDDSGTNYALGSGMRVDASSVFPTARFSNLTGSSTTNTGDKLMISDFHIGPGVGSNAEQDTNWLTFNNYDVASQGYTKFAPNDSVFKSQANDSLTFASTGNATIFAFCGSKLAESAGGTPATVSFRLWYMCHSDPSGWTRFTG